MKYHYKKILQLLGNECLENQLLAISICKGLENQDGINRLFPKVIDSFEKFCFVIEIELFSQKFTHLTKLSVWHNRNNNYNQSLYLNNLNHLDFSTERALKEIPSIIFNLKKIQTISFTHHQISTVNEGIKKLLHLKKINFSSNQFQSIPEYILELNQLIELSLSNNKIYTIPSEILFLEKIEVLRLDYNNIEVIPSFLKKLKYLKILSLEGNSIEIIPEALEAIKSLEVLILGKNMIIDLPYFLVNMPNLKFLTINDNPCSDSPLIEGKKGNKHIMGKYRIIEVQNDIIK